MSNAPLRNAFFTAVTVAAFVGMFLYSIGAMVSDDGTDCCTNAVLLSNGAFLSGRSVMRLTVDVHGPVGGAMPRCTSLLTTAVACAAVRTGRRPMAIAGMPVSLKSANQSSDEVFIQSVATS